VKKKDLIDKLSEPDSVHGAPSGALRTGLERSLRGVPEEDKLSSMNVDAIQRAVDEAYEGVLSHTIDATVKGKLKNERDRIKSKVPAILGLSSTSSSEQHGIAEPRNLSTENNPTDGPDDRPPHAESD
jgi:hypothetical protein